MGLVYMFIKSKEEDIIPLHMIHIKKNIGHDIFTENQIIIVEPDIPNFFDWDIVFITTYDAVNICFRDLFTI